MRFDTTPSFLNESAVLLLHYLQDPSIKTINSGSSLSEVITAVVEPPFFWDSFMRAFRSGQLNPDASCAFAWLLLELLNRPGKSPSAYVLVANSPGVLDAILKSSHQETRNLGQKIKHTLSLSTSDLNTNRESGPGGRHNNDYASHRDISIMPTADELLCKELPFLRTPDTYLKGLKSSSLGIHIDNQFRLLREDMLGEIRDELQKLQGLKPGSHRGLTLDNIQLGCVHIDGEKFRDPWGLLFQCEDVLPFLKKVPPKDRVGFLKNNRQILRQGTTGCLFVDGEPVAFPAIGRDEEELAKTPARITLHFQEDTTVPDALVKLKKAENIKLVQINTSVFAFEPFLKRLQEMRDVPLAEELLSYSEGQPIQGPSFQPSRLKHEIERSSGKDIRALLNTPKPVILDDSQVSSLLAILFQRVSLIQGPPGTGKSFIGALGAKIIHDFTDETIVVWDRIKELESSLARHKVRLESAFKRYISMNVSKQQILDYLEFLEGDIPFFDTFLVPVTTKDSMSKIGKKGKALDKFYLLNRWIRKMPDAGTLKGTQSESSKMVWAIRGESRPDIINGWTSAILQETAEEVHKIGRQFNEDQSEKQGLFDQRDVNTIKSKRIIGCTTTAAAKYSNAIQAAQPGVLLVEEAGEILEAHIFTALGKNTQQLIMIGDHQQLRPKCNSYGLKVEQGDGYNLDMSLFERMVLDGFPHVTLTKQHRSRPEISSIIRHLTYPELIDADSTRKRKNLLGVRDNLIFIDHRYPEDNVKVKEMRDNVDSTSSKSNGYEANMILKCVKYLAQQGYGSDQLVVLTPYLGQLRLLREKLATENDLILNDLDKYDLIRAGLYVDTGVKKSKPTLKISTVDNYQGEESDIVLVSMTRSNSRKDIGFMSQPQRLNVLISRARNGLIMIGNSDTFINSRKGKEIWKRFFDFISAAGHVYQGLPVRCENHPDRIVNLYTPEDFEKHCPDGGCKDTCGALLNCKIHHCPSSCHQILDHSKILCSVILEQRCPNGHKIRRKCHEGLPSTSCSKCKTTVARLYAKVLTSLQVLPGDEFIETTGSHLAHGGVNDVKKHLEILKASQGGVYFIDEAYQLTEGHNFGGKTVLDYLLTEIENLVGKVAFVFAGYRKQMEKFFEHNPGLQSRLPYTLRFEDYTDTELLQMLQYQMQKFYPLPIKIEDGQNGLYMHIAVQRLGRGRNRDGFGNARALENMFAKIRGRQADRLSKERKDGLSPDDNLITKEDLIGPDPSLAILNCKSWDQLQSLTGLDSVKNSIRGLIDMIKTNYARELKNLPPIYTSLNRVFLGSPGTGKTTVAKLYGRILSDLGLLSNGEVVIKNPADFIGSVMGQSEENTKNILASTMGKGGSGADTYRTAVIDTIVAEVQNVPGDDQCVLLLGYEDKMVEMFQNVNPGLTRRFALKDAFNFADFNDKELEEILNLKIKTQGLGATTDAVSVAIDLLSRARNGLNFGNGGEVENLISRAKHNYQSRQSKLPADQRSIDFVFEPQDFDPDFDRAAGAETNLKELFKGLGKDPTTHIPMNFIFKGPPGTGKTTTARKIGQVYYDLGLLSEVKVVECSASDLVGQYVGHTGPQTVKQLELGLGKVLFIDEAYRLGQGHFAQEAIDELVDSMTKPKLLSANEGLNSRFADEIVFPALSPKDSLLILQNALKKENIVIDYLEDISSHRPFLDMIAQLSVLPAWGNARDMITLAKSMIRAVYQSTMGPISDNSNIILTYDEATACIQTMIDSKKSRAMVQGKSSRDLGVSDAVWAQLQQDKKANEEEARRYSEEMRKKQEEIQALVEAEQKAREEALREIEREMKARVERRRIEQERERQRLEEMERRQKEQKAQDKLAKMGVCIAGFQWI
ncbi:hypothetical protein DID88_002088 [Monilinia fructigena]|uniref:AAA+ ATPase domain-containing protein n=1 Tax=Monilinia fructigena TaxID=38457 RepID=A0A395IV65_9HELO|nr:hypothetical protein DID88_002088 [Monilinia fructigena]